MGMREALANVPAVDKGPWVTEFGASSFDWNIHADDDEQDDEGSGLPGRGLVRNALQLLGDCWGGYDPETAARVLNLPPTLIAGIELDENFELGGPEDVVLSDLAGLVQAITGCRGGSNSVALIARLTNQHPVRIVEAVATHCWLYLFGDRDDFEALWIEAEGE